MNNKQTLYFLVLIVTVSCTLVRKPHFYLQAKERRRQCEERYIGQDTTYIDSENICVFQEGYLIASGKLVDNARKGIWYHFDNNQDSVDCFEVIRYKKNDKVFLWTRSSVNRKW